MQIAFGLIAQIVKVQVFVIHFAKLANLDSTKVYNLL